MVKVKLNFHNYKSNKTTAKIDYNLKIKKNK